MSDAVRAKVAEIIVDEFATKYPGMPVFFENQKFTQPKGAPWAYVSIIPNLSKRKDMGETAIWRHMGVVMINVMVPEDTGTKGLMERADTAFYALADKNFALGDQGYLKLCHANRRNRGVVNGWLAYVIQVEYHQDVRAPA